MIDVKAIAGGIVIAGSLGLATLGACSGVANADPTPVSPQLPSVQGASQEGDQGIRPAPPSPYAAYGGTSICATPGLYFVNICS